VLEAGTVAAGAGDRLAPLGYHPRPNQPASGKRDDRPCPLPVHPRRTRRPSRRWRRAGRSRAGSSADGRSLALRLLELLRLCNDWLKFAETKNVGIVGLAGSALAIVVAAVSFLRAEGIPPPAGVGLVVASLLMALSLLAGVWSFMPATSTPRWMRLNVGDPHPDDNLFYFGHAAKYAPRPLAEAVARRYERQPEPAVSDLHHDLAAQLVVNARITLQKLKLFRWAVLLFAGGALLSAAGMLAVLLV
jgi:hypothetical protein